MAHVVRFRSQNGEEHLEDVEGLDAALERVERLRNEQGVTDVRVYRQVPLEFRAYYRAAVVDEPGVRATPSFGGPSLGEASVDEARGPENAPPGSMPLSPPPVTTHDENVEAVDEQAENRKISLFNRGNAS